MAPSAAKPSQNRWFIIGGLAILALAILALAITGLIVAGPHDGSIPIQAARSFSIPSSSMAPTLQVGDYILANMRAYEVDAPRRGDLVILTLPRDPAVIWIKRVVGLSGEKIQMRSGVLHIDGQAVPTVDAGSYKLPGESKEVPLKRETLPNGVSFLTLDLDKNGFYDNTEVYEVPPGHYFVLGDNRDNSLDSRVLGQVGYIPRANLIGRPTWIYWSSDLSRIGTTPR